jgi:competence protein ComEC
LFFAKFIEPIHFSWILFFIICLIIFRNNKNLSLAFLLVLFLTVGFFRGGQLQAANLKYENYFGKKVTVIGIAQEDGYYSNSSQLEFNISNVEIDGQALPGKVKVKGYGEPAVYRYDKIEATGKLYSTKGSRQAGMSYADITVLATTNSWLDDFRRKFLAGMETALPEPAASFGIGILIGQRSLLPDNILVALTAVGLIHIVAVSGYNLTIIVDFIKRISSRLSRFQVLFLSSLLIYGFILITGFSPSIVRASIVSILSLVAWYFGRKIRPVLLIVFVAALTGYFNPYFVWGDIGWYLSFLAFSGILILAPLIIKLTGRAKLPALVTIGVETFSAQIMTTPLIMMVFGRVSVVGFLANVITVPFVPFAMLFSFIAGLAGMIIPAVSGWIGLPARLLLNAILLVAEKLASLPGAQKLASLSWQYMLVSYLAIAIFIVAMNKRSQSVKIRVKE